VRNFSLYLGSFVFGAFCLGATTYAISGVAAYLDQAAARQCLERDWPPSQYQAHVDWCRQEGYPLGR